MYKKKHCAKVPKTTMCMENRYFMITTIVCIMDCGTGVQKKKKKHLLN